LILTSTSVIARQFAVTLASAAAAIAFGFGVAVVTAPTASAATECTNQQPYPDSPLSICIGYGRSCWKSFCSAAPGTEGKTDINGDYEPCMGSCSNPYD
jgi:hypothetical protein